MARVPTYQPNQVQANLGSTPQVDVRTSQQAFGGGGQVAEAASQAVDSVANTFIQYRVQADEIAVTEADAKASAITNDLIFNPQKGFMSKKGKDAFGIEDQYVPEFDKSMNEIEAGLSNDRQRAFFKAKRAQYGFQKCFFALPSEYPQGSCRYVFQTLR